MAGKSFLWKLLKDFRIVALMTKWDNRLKFTSLFDNEGNSLCNVDVFVVFVII